jgi:predicted MFS family arabinose efflux permease
MRELFAIRSFALVWIVGFFQSLGFFLLVNVPGRFLELGLTEGRIGLIYAMAAFTGLAVRPSLGRTLDVVRRRTVIRAAGLVHVGAVVGLAVTAAAGAVLLGWFVLARVSQIVIFTATLTYAADALPAALRARGLAIFGLSGLVPIALSNLVGDRIIVAAGYTGAIAASAVLAFVASVLVWWLPALPVMGERARRSFWAALAQPDLRMVWFITLVFSMGVESLFAFMRTFVDTHPEVGTLGSFFAVYGGLAVVTRLLNGRRFDAVAPRRTAAAGVGALGIGILLLAFAEGPSGFLAAAALGGAAHGVVFPVLSAQVVSRARTSERGSAMATFTSIFDVAVLGLVPVVGLLIDVAGYPTAFTSIATSMVVGAALYVVWDRRRSDAAAIEVSAAGSVG